jgi:hypothetical protein
LEREEQRAFETTVRRFAAQLDDVLFAIEGPDGDLDRVPQLLAEARALDMLADPAPGAPGHELGVWGTHCCEEGLAHSLLILSLLGESCAGFAAAVHAQGLACLALGAGARLSPGTPLAAVLMPDYGIPLSDRLRSEGNGLWWVEGTIQGSAHFLLAAELPQKLVCFARKGSEWISLLLDAGAAGVNLVEVQQRTGLRAARQYHLHCDQVPVPGDQILRTGNRARRSLAQVLACDWLGQAAIALGVALRSLRDSRDYTAQRYQGGRLIEGHASIQLLQGTATYDIALLTAILFRHADEPLAPQDPEDLLRWATGAKLAVVEHAHRAVTHCLQTLGGYGYMEDYGLEKRLRDVSTLKSLHGAPDQLKIFLNELASTPSKCQSVALESAPYSHGPFSEEGEPG